MGETVLIIDGDVVAFRCAAANESRSIVATHKVTGQATEHAHRTAFKEHIKGSFEADEFDIEDVQTAQDLRFALHAVKTTIDALCKTCGADSYEVYISGESNFRDRLPLPTKYKSNRVGGLRPLQLKECREYLVDHHCATAAVDCEADDVLAQRAYEAAGEGNRHIIATNDKDAYGVASWLYNWTKMTEPLLIEGLGQIALDEKKKLRGHGRKWVYTQICLGDSVDAFKPCELSGKKFGDVSAFKLLGDCTSDKECVEAMVKLYKGWYPEPVTYTAWDGTTHTKDWIQLMQLYADCVHMRRFTGDQLNIEKMLKKLKIEY